MSRIETILISNKNRMSNEVSFDTRFFNSQEIKFEKNQRKLIGYNNK